MKKNIIIAALAVAGGVAAYLLNKKRPAEFVENSVQPNNASHHVTKVFSKAKQHAATVA